MISVFFVALLCVLASSCVRFRLSWEALKRWEAISKTQLSFDESGWDDDHFPGALSPILVSHKGTSGLVVGQWGLIPEWKKEEPKFGLKSGYNARSETVHELPTFREAFQKRRCIVPLSSFLEQVDGRWLEISLKSGDVLGIAGLWEPPYATVKPTFSLVTTEPNEFIGEFHDRMPVILAPENYDEWLSRETSFETLKRLMTPCPSDWLKVEDAGSTRRKPFDQDELF